MSGKTKNRGIVLLASACASSVTGSFYMWSIFNKPLAAAYGWSPEEISLAYSLFLLMVCVAGFVGGLLQNTSLKPKYILLVSGIALSLGWFFTSYATTPLALYLVFSIFAGFFDGIVYNTSISTAVKWFPDKKGFANGVCIGTVGLSPLLFAPLGNALIEMFDVAACFRICGMIFLVVFLIFSWFISKPEDGWTPEGWSGIAADSNAGRGDMNAGKMMKQPLFYTLWLLFAMAATSGLMLTGHAAAIGVELAGLTASQAALQVGILAAASFAGRLGFGAISDVIGRYSSLLIVLAITAIDMLFFIGNSHDFITFAVTLSIVGMCFGGVMTILPSICGDVFGMKYFGMNYAILFSGYTCASFIGPSIAASVLLNTGSYGPAFTIAGILTLVGFVFLALSKALNSRMRKNERMGK